MLNPAADFARRFARNRAALVGLVLVIVMVGVALAAPWMFPKNPLRIVGRPEIWPFVNSRFHVHTSSTRARGTTDDPAHNPHLFRDNVTKRCVFAAERRNIVLHEQVGPPERAIYRSTQTSKH